MLLKIWIELNIFASAYPVVLALFIETALHLCQKLVACMMGLFLASES